MLPTVSSVCYLVRVMYPYSNKTTLKMIYFAYFHAVMEYGVILWGNSAESKGVFQQQERIIRIMTGSSSRIIYKPLFQKLETATLPSQCIPSLMR
jgi:hypothetical protein